MPNLRIWFYDPSSDTEGVVNKLVAYADPPYCHCELQFPDGSACSIYMGSSVLMKKRAFDTTSYTLIEVSASEEQVQHAYKSCIEARDLSIKFSSVQMLSCIYLWPSTSTNQKYTFCSKLIAKILVDASILPDNTNVNITPSALHRLLAPLRNTSSTCDALDLKPGETLFI